MTDELSKTFHRIAWLAALTAWLAWGWPLIKVYMLGHSIRDYPISPYLFIPYAIFGLIMLTAMAVRFRPAVLWSLLAAQLAAIVAMVVILPWAGLSSFLIIIAWQAAVATTPRRAFGWAVFQTLVIVGVMAQAISPDLCWIFVKSFAMQLLLLFMARALKSEAAISRELAQTNRELKAAQAIIANNVRDAERLRISRELHDAWGHELTALGLQLEIASNVAEPTRANDHVLQAKGLARTLLSKVRDVVATLRDAERYELKDALEALAKTVPTPAIHVAIAPGVAVNPEQTHALVRCAQEAVTNAVRHAHADNLWLEVTPDGAGVRLVARNDGHVPPATAAPGSGLLGMRERLEGLGGRLAVRPGPDFGFTIDAWLPTPTPKLA